MILKQYGDEVSLGESMYFGFRYSSGVTSSIGCRGEETAACRPFLLALIDFNGAVGTMEQLYSIPAGSLEGRNRKS